MKKLFSILIFCLFSVWFTTTAQVSINADGIPPDSSAMLDIQSTTKGLLVPRMTDAQRASISNPATGLLIFSTTNNQFYLNQGTPGLPNWVMINSQWITTGSNIYYSTGNVGIGVTDPQQKLHVSGKIAADYGSYTSPTFVFGNGAENTGFSSPTPYSITFITNGTEKARIDNAGTLGLGTSTPNSSAMLDVQSTTKGFLPPRLTTTQRDSISSPALGLTIYNTSKLCIETYNDSTGWVSNTHYIGESYGGGIVFYIYDMGQHGLIAATSDQSTGIQWYNGSYTTTNAVRDQVNAGRFNTERIIINQGTGSYAAQICANYQGGGYGDWYLPSKFELNLLFYKKDVVGGFFMYGTYWSSTEFLAGSAWCEDFGGGYQHWDSKDWPVYYVRAVRAF